MDSLQGPTSTQLSQNPKPGVQDAPTHAVCMTVLAARGVMASRGFVPRWEKGSNVYFAG